jgi:hypothetical protein
MKTRRPTLFPLPAALAAALLLAAAGTAQAASPQMRGFRGLMWGDPPSHLGNALEVARDGDVRCYRRERENLLFGDSELRAVQYCFRGDRLFMVALDALVDARALRAEFERGYGPPDESRGLTLRWRSAGQPVSAEIVSRAADAPATLRLRSDNFAR